MATTKQMLAATLVAAAFGAVAAGVVVTLQQSLPDSSEPPMETREPPERVGHERPSTRRPPAYRPPRRRERREPVFSSDYATGPASESGRSLSELLSSDDEEVRLRTALQLLRRGTDALPQVRALRPRTEEGRALAQQMAVALHKLKLNERSETYGRLPPSERMRLRLATYESVLPREMLALERRECWQGVVDINRALAEKGRLRLTSGEVALAELELARAQLELGAISQDEYRAVLDEKSGVVDEWIASLRGRRAVSPAQLRRHEQQWADLRN